ncbi:RimK family protein [Paraliomyxa miuraensis]|uniref:RimK family protein n=1 Tax=Paraliomyxa miuraensis TaxID=376150 RepID=UPI0022513261|nr:RimK family protein [Paraliomyxa miuraensis]MCX4244089.1 RimK family protein [Paraliomyxa miuraensis]
MRTLIVVNDVAHGPVLEGTELVAARDYLSDPSWAEQRRCRVLNLCRSYRYQKVGYYVSLLAHARGHRPIPTLATIQAAKSSTIVRFVSDELYDEIQRSFAKEPSGSVTLEIFFGRETTGLHAPLGAALFGRLALPLMRATFGRNDRTGEWSLSSCAPLATEQLALDRRALLVDAMRTFLRRRHTPHRPDHGRYDLAILHDPREAEPPSNDKALRLFQKAAEAEGFAVEMIAGEDYARIGEFDALFIRETTAVNHRTFRFAQRAAAAGLVVIDDPESILRCTNKVYLAEVLGRHGIPAPKTLIAHRGNLAQVAEALGFPCVLKQPDSSFSQGVVKAADAEAFKVETAKLLKRSDLVVAQAFMPTAFDWRVGVLARKPIYACKYFMARRHWQIVRRDGGQLVEGNSVCVPLEDVPPSVLDVAVRAANLMGDGLYGVDLKEVDGKAHVIEVNDNPSIDAGCEDERLGESLYRTIMADFRRRLDERRGLRSPGG